MKITKDEFERYEEVRLGGTTNMFLIKNVVALSGLTREEVIYIMRNYEELYKKFN